MSTILPEVAYVNSGFQRTMIHTMSFIVYESPQKSSYLILRLPFCAALVPQDGRSSVPIGIPAAANPTSADHDLAIDPKWQDAVSDGAFR